MLKQRLKLLKDEYEHYFTDGGEMIWWIGLHKTSQREGKQIYLIQILVIFILLTYSCL